MKAGILAVSNGSDMQTVIEVEDYRKIGGWKDYN